MGLLTATRIESARVRLREATNEDADGFIETQVDERVRRFLGVPHSEPNVRATLEAVGAAALLSRWGLYVVTSRESADMLGTMVLRRRGPELPGHLQDDGNELELGYVFRPHAWGNGYATEAARALLRCAAAELSDQPVVIVTQTVNRAARRVADRLGFSVVARSSNTTLSIRWRPRGWVCSRELDRGPAR
jgi:RimJ/RimL family protein N-acetyltransferase